jgi:hypothetical protein
MIGDRTWNCDRIEILLLAIAYAKLRLGFKTVARIITIKFQVRMK